MEPIRLALKLGNERPIPGNPRGNLGPYAVQPGTEILIGRIAVNGLTLDDDWTPRVLARIVPAGDLWLLVNGPSGDVEVRNSWVQTTRREKLTGKGKYKKSRTVTVGSTFKKNAAIALPPGLTFAEWHIFDDNVRLRLQVGGDIEGLEMLHPEAIGRREDSAGRGARTRVGPARTMFKVGLTRIRHDRPIRGRTTGVGRTAGTARGARDDTAASGLLTPHQRHVMALVFRHLLEDKPRPTNLAKAAATEPGMNLELVKKCIRDVKKKVNAQRDGWDLDLNELGEWLVEKTHFVTLDDLRRDWGGPPGDPP
jgi:hypothetical protein